MGLLSNIFKSKEPKVQATNIKPAMQYEERPSIKFSRDNKANAFINVMHKVDVPFVRFL